MRLFALIAFAAFAGYSALVQASTQLVELTTGTPPAFAHRSGVKSTEPYSRQSYFELGHFMSRTGPVFYRTFFVFDLSGVHGKVVAAELQMFNGSVASQDLFETVSLYDVSTTTSDLFSQLATQEIVSDLGSGVAYGTNSEFSVAADASAERIFPLNASALHAINSNVGGVFAMGASIDSVNLQRGTAELIRPSGQYRESTLRLIIVPEPPVTWLLAPLTAALHYYRRAVQSIARN